MDRPTDAAGSPGSDAVPAASRPQPEPVQRWRLTFGRDPVAPDMVGRAAVDAWQAALAASGLAVARLGSPTAGEPSRYRFSLGAPLQAASAGRAELAEIWLLERVAAWRLREALADRLPPGHRWVDAEDVWLGAPPLPGQVVAAEWIVLLAPAALDAGSLAAAAHRVLAAPSLPRVRAKAGGERTYDLRPLVSDVSIAGGDDGRTLIRITTRLDPALGSGRPAEVVAVLGEAAGATTPPAIESIVRERLVLAEPGGPAAPSRLVSSPKRPRR